MFPSIRKAALTLFPALFLASACGILSGCKSSDTEKVGQAVSQTAADVQRGLTAKDRTAIQAVGTKLSAATDKLSSDPKSWDEMKGNFHSLYETVLDTDVSSCPSDFRDQYQRVIKSLGSFNDAMDDVPTDDSDQLAYFLQQLGSSNPDYQGKEVLRQLETRRQDMYHQLSELKAVAHQYGADQSF